MANTNEEVVRELYAAFAVGDLKLDTMASLFADDPIWHVPGRNKLAGDYRGVDAVLGYFGALNEATGDSFEIDEVHDVLANDQHVVVIQNSSANRNGEKVRFQEVLVFHVSNGKITEVWENTNPSYEYDELIG